MISFGTWERVKNVKTIKEITYIHFKQGINLLLKDWESFKELLKKNVGSSKTIAILTVQ